MIDKLKRFREPAAVVALLVLLFECGATVVRFVVETRTTAVTTVMRGTTGLFGLVDGMVLTALVLSCVMVVPVARYAKALTLVSAVLMAVGAVTGVVLLVGALLDKAGWFSRFLESLGGIADIAFKALFAWLLWHGHQAVVESEREASAAAVTATPAGAGPGTALPPVWAADQATGVAWRRAGDAAGGAAAATYGSGPGGWRPELPAVRPDGSLLPPVPGDPAMRPDQLPVEPGPTRAMRVIAGDDEAPGAGRATPPLGPRP